MTARHEGAAAGSDATNPTVSLTEAQRACLRLVHQHKTSKEIARLLGISKHTVDQRLERACRLLGVEGRIKAALLLAEYEDASISDRVLYDPVTVAQHTTGRLVHEAPDEVALEGGAGVAQEQAVYGRGSGAPHSLWRTLVPGGKPADLTPAARIKWIAQLMVQIVIALLVLIAIAVAASSVAEQAWPSRHFATS